MSSEDGLSEPGRTLTGLLFDGHCFMSQQPLFASLRLCVAVLTLLSCVAVRIAFLVALNTL